MSTITNHDEDHALFGALTGDLHWYANCLQLRGCPPPHPRVLSGPIVWEKLTPIPPMWFLYSTAALPLHGLARQPCLPPPLPVNVSTVTCDAASCTYACTPPLQLLQGDLTRSCTSFPSGEVQWSGQPPVCGRKQHTHTHHRRGPTCLPACAFGSTCSSCFLHSAHKHACPTLLPFLFVCGNDIVYTQL